MLPTSLLPLLPLFLFTISRVRAAEGPCDLTPPVCYDIMNASTCFASINMGGSTSQPPEDVLKCVNAEDAVSAKEVVCKCWGCDSALIRWIEAQSANGTSYCPSARRRW
ncbi:hypothetical protein GQ43DRAFT_461777, partial [Delitschia confertaspora ATCC 74209]